MSASFTFSPSFACTFCGEDTDPRYAEFVDDDLCCGWCHAAITQERADEATDGAWAAEQARRAA